MERVLRAVGSLLPHEDAAIAAQVAGRIERLDVDLGDRVVAGQELALIDTAAYAALAQRSAANLARAVAAAEAAARDLARIRALHDEGITSAGDLDRAVSAAQTAAAEVKAAEAADAVARLDLARSRVRAPFAAEVAERRLGPGSYASVGTPILRLVRTDPLRLRLEVTERDATAVRVGQPVRLRVEGDDAEHAGRLTRVAPLVGIDDRMLRVEADVPRQGALRPGLFARAEIVVGAEEPSLAVPAAALLTFAGIDKVVVIVDGRAAERSVTTGRRGPDWVEIVDGLDAGATVVLEPGGLRTGDPVRAEGDGR